MMLKLVEEDKLLKPFAGIIEKRHQQVLAMEREFTYRTTRLSDKCNSYLYYGLHRTNEGWVFREWAPNATAIYLLGEFNDWRKHPDYVLTKVGDGNWEIKLPLGALVHEMLYRLLVEWNGGSGERLPSHVRRVIQDEYTKIYSAQVWDPLNPYQMRHERPKRTDYPLIYEAHIGMSTEHRRVSTFTEFRLFVLPRIVDLGYNTIQLMAVQEHPYYGSFGYQVANFFAVSSRFGTPDELKALIDAAHSMGIRVIMDIVHSHAVNNEEEGLSRFDGSYDQYFYPGDRGYHPLWGSRCFDYGKHEVLNFLLSNCKYWLEEFRFDGYRFDGITSMLYWDHGINKDFTEYSLYYDGNQDESAITYLALANRVIHQVDPEAITIAEDMSGMPGVASPIEDGGMGFDYRMNMGTPDYWIKLLKEKRDEEWHVGDLFYELTNKREEEHTISYAESHDQALVGDKTIFFRLVDKAIYSSMGVFDKNVIIDRGMSLHKMIRLVTIGTAADGYLNFMGNEWGHPEWIDFPREGNGWSYDHARRLWSLVDDENLRFRFLNMFDKAMIQMVNDTGVFHWRPEPLVRDNERQVLIFTRGDYLFVFNFNPEKSFPDYVFDAPSGKYTMVLNTDNKNFDGVGRIDEEVEHFTRYVSPGRGQLSLYVPARTGFVLRRS
ncbi:MULTISPECIES: alpha-amylase family glycosyl hydrolase [Butyricimonas]|jgi:alpha amylase all-beta|uniref:1,4-alpha-glucan branching enzyme n=1 Tax=Butyricimonas faecihominis TaxID=1472416 RepID=A0A7W6HU50_9BACT|nr:MULTISPECIES: alpha amylase C-terminal domain-containing protein [Butyricimonas]MBS6688035.1 alpha amylase C-terminal domain-containing protein [Sanguibacteroides justesenii]KAB1504632.1 1,4-alpha-glucan-branching enzyme [Butyricimonas faecihominis]MBB4025031.1 1,4-alpha-glucan branching enzyme [Butyricimonas faecihominis]WOF08572.1 1,4-alpha-glucan-branching enzyme [Butyricimonas faecihominis]BEI55280.1 alpha amylase C-terminal domain-containing protein [Butyricimonas faecihominis]